MSSYAEVLVDKGLVSVEDIDSAQRLHEEKGLRLDQALIENGAITERAFLEVMAERFDFEIIDLPNEEIEDDAIRSLPSRFVYRNHLAPISCSTIRQETSRKDEVGQLKKRGVDVAVATKRGHLRQSEYGFPGYNILR